MPKQTFLNLSAHKQDNISNILFEEFSNYSLLEANVGRIVKAAGIARGSFYTYFADMDDAYLWSLKEVFGQIHESLAGDDPVQASIDFVNHVEGQKYYNFLSNYYVINQAILEAHHQGDVAASLNLGLAKRDLPAWLGEVAIHQLVRAYFLAPDNKADIMAVLKQLDKWYKKEK
ncbi:TetR/AcrR family transcriptional regulator [Lactobacillaceae bacterium L1_55_11]|nr:TetR/AcrR family transcriptional regulator [Lactobacillaceae bacterium L1_55_11]